MPRTLGYHIVISGYGLWLPGDERGHWSEAWDEELGYIEPHTLHAGNPIRKRMAEERQKHPAVRLTAAMQPVVIETIAHCRAESNWRIAAASIESTHTHLLMTYSDRDIDHTIKWLKDQTTKAIHRQTQHAGPVWCKGSWRSFIFDLEVWRTTQAYIERHNTRPPLPIHRPGQSIKPRPLVADCASPHPNRYDFIRAAPARDHRSRLYAHPTRSFFTPKALHTVAQGCSR